MNPWSVFWRQGHSTTFGDYFKQGYEGAVADWWRSVLGEFPSGGTVIEVGCGNCSLLPAMVSSGASGRYVGVDVARVGTSPVAEQGLEDSGIEVTVHSGTPAETVPEADGSADIVASVFGIEYSDLGRSVPEAARLLKPGGRFCALLHHDQSVVTSMSRQALSDYDSGDVWKTLESLTAIHQERDRVASLAELKNSRKAEEGRREINSLAQRYLADTHPQTVNETMHGFMKNALKFFRMMGAGSEQRNDFIRWLQAEYEASNERNSQMVSVAMRAPDVDALKAICLEAGFEEVRAEVLHSGTDILAWNFQAAKPGKT